MMELPHIIMLAATSVAAFTDSRTGLIPNWLTLPTAIAGPAYALWDSPSSMLQSLMALVVVGLVPYLMYRMDSLGGGDVKLFAGLGGLGGLTLGLEVLMYSMVAAMAVAMITMANRGHLKVVLLNVGRMLSNPFLPKARRRPLESRDMHQLRLGLSIFVGTGASLAYHYSVI